MLHKKKSVKSTGSKSIKEELDEIDRLEVESGKINPEDKNHRYKKLLRFKLKELKKDPYSIGDHEGAIFLDEMIEFAKSDLKQIMKNPANRLGTIDDYFDDFADIIAICTNKLNLQVGTTYSALNHDHIKELKKQNRDAYETIVTGILLNKKDDFKKPAMEWNTTIVNNYLGLLDKSLRMYDKMHEVLEDLNKKYNHFKHNPYLPLAGYGRKLLKFSRQVKSSSIRPAMFILKFLPYFSAAAGIVLLSYFSHLGDIKKVEDAKISIVSCEQNIRLNNYLIESNRHFFENTKSTKKRNETDSRIFYLKKMNKDETNRINNLKAHIWSLTNDWEYIQWERTGLFNSRRNTTSPAKQ